MLDVRVWGPWCVRGSARRIELLKSSFSSGALVCGRPLDVLGLARSLPTMPWDPSKVPNLKAADPLLRSAAAQKFFEEWKAEQPKVEWTPPAKANTSGKHDPEDPFGLKTDPRSVRWPLEVMGCSRVLHKSHYTCEAYPETRFKMYGQHGKHSVGQYLLPGQPYAPMDPPLGLKQFSTAPPAPQTVPYLSLSYTQSRSDGKMGSMVG